MQRAEDFRVRIVTLNIWFGGGNARRFERILNTLHSLSPDVVALQECLGWEDGRRLQETAHELALPHTYLGLARPRPSGFCYHVALLSRWPLENPVSYADPAVNAHCVVHAQVQGIDLLATHLDGHDEDLRLDEARWLNQLRVQERPAVLAADLNSLSPQDPYPEDLAQLLRERGVAKYGPGVRRDVMAELLGADWVDPLYSEGPPPVWETASRAGLRFRTDYTLVSRGLAASVLGCRVVPVDEEVSDHCPVVLDFEPAAPIEKTGASVRSNRTELT